MIALIGSGKTGGHLLHVIPKDELLGPFNSKRPFDDNLDEVNKSDAAICFLSGEIFQEKIDSLKQIKVPLIIGTTGIDLSSYNQWCKDNKRTWIISSNFAGGMPLVRKLLNTISEDTGPLSTRAKVGLKEIHHTKKKDAPSGTAKSFLKWLGNKSEDALVESIREGDEVGTHEVTLVTDEEVLTIRHESLDRSIFAKGAYWAAKKIIEENMRPYGVIDFHYM